MFYKHNDEQVAAEEFDGEFVLINFARGTYFSLRHAAVDVWRQFRNGASPAQVEERIRERFAVAGDDARAELKRCIQVLIDEELLREAPAPGAAVEDWSSQALGRARRRGVFGSPGPDRARPRPRGRRHHRLAASRGGRRRRLSTMELAAPAARAQVDPRAAALCAALLEFAEQASPELAARARLPTLRRPRPPARRGRGFEEHLTRALRHAGVAPGAARAPALQRLRGRRARRGRRASAGLAPSLRKRASPGATARDARTGAST